MKPIALLPGGGRGPERIEAMRRVVEATGTKVPWQETDSADAARRVGTIVSGAPGPRTGLLLTRAIRACRTLEGVPAPDGEVDVVIVRGDDGEAAHAAFSYAAMEARLKVTIAHEGGPFLEQAREAGRDYPQLRIEEAGLQDVERNVAAYDVLLCPGEPGRRLADQATGLVGGPEWVAEARFGPDGSLFCPAHEANVVSPVATILAAALALEHINEHQACARVRRAVESAIESRPENVLEAILAKC